MARVTATRWKSREGLRGLGLFSVVFLGLRNVSQAKPELELKLEEACTAELREKVYEVEDAYCIGR